MRKSSISKFYEDLAKQGKSIRWTSPEMLRFDVSVVKQVMSSKDSFSWIDVGCGTGEMQHELAGSYSFCIGIDPESGFRDKFLKNPSNYFMPGFVNEIKISGRFNLGTAFGVATYMTEEEAIHLYISLKDFTKDGVTVVKHQCSYSYEINFDGFSEKLNSDYSARYPSLSAERLLLEKIFDRVRVIAYPKNLNTNENSGFFAFVCSS